VLVEKVGWICWGLTLTQLTVAHQAALARKRRRWREDWKRHDTRGRRLHR
jgi:hypothetical protein